MPFFQFHKKPAAAGISSRFQIQHTITIYEKIKKKGIQKNVKRKYPDKAYLPEGFRAFA